jgi:hypothetical protein
MDDPTACSHPLYVSGADYTFVSETISMLYITGQHIGDVTSVLCGIFISSLFFLFLIV